MDNKMKEGIKKGNMSLQNMKKKQLLALISDSFSGIQKQCDDSKKLAIKIQAQHDKVNNLSSEMQKQYDESKKLAIEIQAQHDKANNLSSETQKQYDESKKLAIEIQAQHDKANNLSSETQKQYDESKKLVTEIQAQHGKTNNLFNEIQKQHDGAAKLIEEKKQKLEELIEQINGLLPGATSAGLASSYLDAWKEKGTGYYWAGFICSLTILVFGYFLLIYKPQDIKWLDIVVRTIVGAPLIWIAWYCQKSISQTNRIKEEYHHKQRIMSIFEGFSKQIDELTKDNPEQNKVKKLDLISVIISAIRKNPSEILDPSETFLDSLKSMKLTNQSHKEKDKNSEEEKK